MLTDLRSPVTPDQDHAVAVLDQPLIFGAGGEERFDRVTRLCQRLFAVPFAVVNLVVREGMWAKSIQGAPAMTLPREETFCATTLLGPGELVVEDARADPRYAQLPSVAGEPGVRFYAGVALEAPGGQRVGTLCLADVEPRSFSASDLEVLHDLALWVQKELNLDEELDRAAEVQRAMFPLLPPADRRYDVAGACRPSREVGGDFYDWHASDEGTVLALGDVMGKGMPAAITMASVRSALRVGAQRTNLGETLDSAARSVAADLQATQSFATAMLARLEVGGWVACADAGHGHAAVIRTDGSVEVIDEGGLPLGIDFDESYVTHELRLGHGDLLLIHSDGLIELDDGPRSSFEAAELVAGAGSAQEAVDRLLGLIGEKAPSDDVTVVVAHRR